MCEKQDALNLENAYHSFNPKDVYVVAAIKNYTQENDESMLKEFFTKHNLTYFMSGSDELGGHSQDYNSTFVTIAKDMVYFKKLPSGSSVDDIKSMIEESLDTFANLHLKAPVPTQIMELSQSININLNDVFLSDNGDPIAITVDENTNPSAISATINDSILTLQSSESTEMATITLKAQQGHKTIITSFEVLINLVEHIAFSEDFENSGSIPTGWTETLITGDLHWQFSPGGQANIPDASHGGSFNALLSANTNSGKETKLITPIIDLSSSVGAVLEFYHSQPIWVSDQDELNVYYKKSNNDDWQLLKSYDSNILQWTKHKIKLPKENLTTTFQIAFHGIAKFGHGVCIDDISIKSYEAPNKIEPENLTAKNFLLLQNYPNPFNPTTTIEFFNKVNSNISLMVYNSNGELVKTLINSKLDKGYHKISFNASHLNSGVYYYKLQTPNGYSVKKMLLIK